jgi:hypothetical protein
MRFSSRITKALYKLSVITLCLAFAGAASSCSELLEDDDPFESTSYMQGGSSSVTSEETVQTEQGMGFERISRAYIHSAWYDVEKDNPAGYDTIDTAVAYALKCVFYFNEPVTGTFKAVLIKDGQKLLEKRIRLDGKVIAECDFSAGLEGLSTFGEGTYSIQLETDGSTVAVSSNMRVE